MNKFLIFFLLSFSLFATEMEEILIEDLKEVKELTKRHDNTVLKLMNDTSLELSKSWSDSLAKELARVYALVLTKNKNYFIVAVLNPILKNSKLDKAFKEHLSEDDYNHFLNSIKTLNRERKNGNG